MAVASMPEQRSGPADLGATGLDRSVEDADRDNDRSNFVAFLMGGVVVAGGLLAFLYYDSDGLTRTDVLTTGSLGKVGVAAPPPPSLAPQKP